MIGHKAIRQEIAMRRNKLPEKPKKVQVVFVGKENRLLVVSLVINEIELIRNNFHKRKVSSIRRYS